MSRINIAGQGQQVPAPTPAKPWRKKTKPAVRKRLPPLTKGFEPRKRAAKRSNPLRDRKNVILNRSATVLFGGGYALPRYPIQKDYLCLEQTIQENAIIEMVGGVDLAAYADRTQLDRTIGYLIDTGSLEKERKKSFFYVIPPEHLRDVLPNATVLFVRVRHYHGRYYVFVGPLMSEGRRCCGSRIYPAYTPVPD